MPDYELADELAALLASPPGTVAGPLSGVVVLDITRVVAGPYCSMILADLGATVIKVEHPGQPDYTREFPPMLTSDRGEDFSAFFAQFNRNKLAITLDLGSAEGKEVLRSLASKADVLVENFRAGAMDRLGLHSDGVATTGLAGALRWDRPLGERAAMLVQLLVDGVYGDFVELVANARGLEEPAVLELAGGRVYSGIGALEAGLVDRLGGLDDAIAAAAQRAGLDEYAVRVLEQPLSFEDRLLLSLLETDAAAPLVRAFVGDADRTMMQVLGWFERELGWVAAGFTEPRKAYLYCFCVAP